jgi:predicted enzyme related to lactoylglutathione lyase
MEAASMTTSGTVAWFQIGTADPDAAKKFYGDLFGWSFAPDPNSGGRYHNVSYHGVEHPSGGIVDTGGAQPNHAIFLVQVNDVAATVAAAEGLGGKVLVPPTSTPNGLTFADLQDSAGNHFGVFTPPV